MTTLPTPFHPGELAVQEKMGVRAQVHSYAPKFVRSYLPDQHRTLLASLPFIVVGSIDENHQPTASILFGFPGMIETPTESSVKIGVAPVQGDPLRNNLGVGSPLGFLAIEFETRRRNRMNGKVTASNGTGFEVEVDQTFGNCPQYIQARSLQHDSFNSTNHAPAVVTDPLNTKDVKTTLEAADTFFIASSYFEDATDTKHGVDVSHRGGKPGFVKYDDGVLTFPDFSGNNHFNTIGNIVLNPKVGLLFPNFETGELLFIEGKAKVIWDGPEVLAFEGAQRLISVEVTAARLLEGAMPAQWHFSDYSPSLESTGSFADAGKASTSEAWRTLRVEKVERESDVIHSFYLSAPDGGFLPTYLAGQHLPIRIPALPKSTRTYTLSRAPSGHQYRLSIKREAQGTVSRHFHDRIRVGDKIDAKAPSGQFHLQENSNKPIVLLSAGVGITPMIAMLESLVSQHGCAKGKQCKRPIAFVHAARNGNEHAFRNHPVLRSANDHGISVTYVYSQPSTQDIVDKAFHARGHIDADLLQSVMTNSESEVYLCGPSGFMKAMQENLRGIGVPANNIKQEAFGPGETNNQASVDIDIDVSLKTSDKKLVWNPSKGSLLDHLEQAGIDTPFSCRAGNCGTCLTKVLKGNLDHPEGIQYAPADGEALICCAKPFDGNPSQDLELDL